MSAGDALPLPVLPFALDPVPTNSAPVRDSSGSAVPLVHEPSASVAAFPWTPPQGPSHLVVVVKCTADILPGAVARVLSTAEGMSLDQAHDPSVAGANGVQERSLRYPSDYVVAKQRADVVLTGHAYAAGGSAGAALTSFRFGHEGRGFLRRIVVLGERHWESALGRYATSLPAPFHRVPLVYERAFGGPGWSENPLGVGFGTSGPSAALVPNLEDPDALMATPRDRPPTACFGPRAKHWGRPDLRPGDDFPVSFDWSSYQCAPRAQQIDRIEGDEPFACRSMHPEHAVVEGRLPGLRARCIAVGAKGGSHDDVPLVLDTVHFDLDAMRLTLLWRGRLGVSDERAPEVSRLYVGYEPLRAAPMTPNELRAKLERAT
jgi:hypothetical protein